MPTTSKPESPESDVPMPSPGWKPKIEEPDPDLLPDELPVPNPDENDEPPKRAIAAGIE